MNKASVPIYDVVIIGAGLSGICAAYHIQDKCPDKSFIVLEGRGATGGTWDLFKYPGIRSDSDMYTLGYSFFPWKNPKAIADGPSILQYIKDTAKEFNLDSKIKYNHKVASADWKDEEELWTLGIHGHEDVAHPQLKTRFLFCCSGYYNYKEGHAPTFEGSENFRGKIIHPQHWDTSLDYSGKKIVVIGSGATAVNLVPELAKKASQVTMLQRSPTYIYNLPSEDVIANFLKKILPAKTAHNLVKWKNILLGILIYTLCRKWPNMMKNFFKKSAKKELGNNYKEKDFDPKYNPWDQRLCLIPDSDLFLAVKNGNANIVTDTIQEFTKNGILLNSGKELEADIIVTATGLKIQILGGMTSKINGVPINSGELKAYKGVMFSDVPNLALAIGYTNASWTLKCDLNCQYVARLLNYMDKNNFNVIRPRFDDSEFDVEPLLDFNSGYVIRANDVLPKQGSKAPWKVYQNYIKDVRSLKYGSVEDKYLEYS
ncbi:MAG: NAD(P)/FAD-dependent oxidoreductase [Bacteroidota bacterium]